MDQRLHSIVGQIFLKFIALRGAYGEHMEDMAVAFSNCGQSYMWMPDSVNIHPRHFLTPLVVAVEMLQFRSEHGSLQLIEPGVAAFIVEYIFLCASIVGDSADNGSK